jgi:hypothetical protein
VAASIGLKILGRGKLSWRALPSAPNKASSAPFHPITIIFASCYSAAYIHPLRGLIAMRVRFQYHLQPTYILRVRISRFVLSSYTPGVDAINEQARTDATPWRCLNMGILFDLLVDAACKVAGFLLSHNRENCFFHSLSAQVAPQYCL